MRPFMWTVAKIGLKVNYSNCGEPSRGIWKTALYEEELIFGVEVYSLGVLFLGTRAPGCVFLCTSFSLLTAIWV